MPTLPQHQGLSPSRLQLPQGAWPTVFEALVAHFPAISRAIWHSRMARGLVLDAAGRALTADTPYRAGALIHYYREVIAEARIPFDEQVLYADTHLVVADKPHFLPVTPAGSYLAETLLTRLIRRFENPHLVPLHRIDRTTAGLVMFSANPASRSAYQALFRERQISKRYHALAPPLPQLSYPYTHRSRIEAGTPFFRMQEVAGLANSETIIEVLGRGERLWHYALTPVTGRKHQLRVHMAALGAAIHNDDFYPALQVQASADYTAPLQLLAQALHFNDPLTGIARHYTSQQGLLLHACAAPDLASSRPEPLP